MKELTTPDKIRLLEETLKKLVRHGLCYRIAVKALELEYITVREFRRACFRDIVRCLIPEFLRLKPVEKRDGDFWFGEPSEANILVRQEKLKELIEILKSKQP